MNWRILKAFPKYAIALGVVVLSTGLFGAWWFFKRSMPRWGFAKPDPAVVAEIKKKADALPDKLGWLALVGGDLYDISTGELMFPNWLRGIPNRVFYFPGSNHLMVQADRGIMRFGLDGTEAGVMGVDTPPAFTHDGKQAMYVKDGDIWVADVDWVNFRYANERQATKYGQFDGMYFSMNAWLTSEKACFVRAGNSAIRVDLLTGDLQQVPLLMAVPGKFRSPDGKMLVIDDGENIVVNDIDKPEPTKLSTNGRRANAYKWVSNDLLVMTMGSSWVSTYDRKKNALVEVIEFPEGVRSLEKSSPDGRYLIANVNRELVFIDLAEKKSVPLGIAADHIEWISGDTIIFSREIPDMKLRGTWIKKVGGEETRVLADPYAVAYDRSASVAVLRELDTVVLATQRALFRMKIDGSELKEFAKLRRPAGRIQAVEKWGL